MKVSSKGRYALACMTRMAQSPNPSESVTVLALSQKLGISKIYLEQVFSLLKRGGLVTSIKGAQGGYLLSRAPEAISAYDVLLTTETALLEAAEDTVGSLAPGIEKALQSLLFTPLDVAVQEGLQGVSLLDLAQEADREASGGGYMYYV